MDNIIEDEEYYYFFRSLEPGDVLDIQNGEILNSDGSYIRLRTDRERWDETHQEPARFGADSEISLDEMYSHIKMHYSLQTNCISFSGDANVVRTYGDTFGEQYVLVKVPKKELGTSYFDASKYMLAEVERIVDEYIKTHELSSDVQADLEKIDGATDSKQIKELIKSKYTAKTPIDTTKHALRKDISYRTAHGRISDFQGLTEEQNLAKNRLIGKLTILERKGGMPPIIPNTPNNNSLIQTIGSAVASTEYIVYKDIQGDRIFNIPREMVDTFSLLQQIDKNEYPEVEKLKQEVLKLVLSGENLEIPEDSVYNTNYSLKDDITIEEMYELTEGKVEYENASSIVKNMFYLSKSRLIVKDLARVLKQRFADNPEYLEIIDQIEKNGFEIEPQIATRRSNLGVPISNTTNFRLRETEKDLIEEIRLLSDEENMQILQAGGFSNTSNIMNRMFSKAESDTVISKEKYYADAIIAAYNWNEINIEFENISLEQRNELSKKLQESSCTLVYERLKKLGVEEKDIPKYMFNIVTRTPYLQAFLSDDYENFFFQNQEIFKEKLSITLIENFLNYSNTKENAIELMDHQQIAVDNTDTIFQNHKFSAVVLPTATGKSYVALAELLKHRNENILYLAPTDEILNQIKKYIIEYHGKENTFGRTDDEIIADIFPHIKFETYPGLLAKRSENLSKEQYGMIVLDELHRTGAAKWEKELDKILENQTENVKVLGITATPVRDSDDRDMTEEVAKKLGYTDEEIENREHIAMYMDTIEAIQLGILVNPRVINCEYSLLVDGTMENLLERIENIEDPEKRQEKMEQYESLRRRIYSAEGIDEILVNNIKNGDKVLVFLPITNSSYKNLKKFNSQEKVKYYEEYLRKIFEKQGISPKIYSMLGVYSTKENSRQLNEFELDESDSPQFMLVISKGDEGLHTPKVKTMVWFRALGQNSTRLFSQESGRVMRLQRPNEVIPEDEIPLIIDLANNVLRVDVNKIIKNGSRRSDLELMTIIADWIKEHDGEYPDIESSSKMEQKYSATLIRLQRKYKKYLEGTGLEKLSDKDRQRIELILKKGVEIDLWNTELQEKTEEELDSVLEIDSFKVRGLMRDFLNLEEDVDAENKKSQVIEKTLKIARILHKNGIDLTELSVSANVKNKYVTYTLDDLVKKGEIPQSILDENGIEGEFNWGKKVLYIRNVYRQQARGTLTEEQRKEVEELGLVKEKAIPQVLRIARILVENGVDVGHFPRSRVEGKNTLIDLVRNGLIPQSVLDENELDEKFPLISKLQYLRTSYNQNTVLTQEERKEAERLGLTEIAKSSVAQTLFVARILDENGIDVASLPLAVKTKGKSIEFTLGDLVEKGLIPQSVLDENGLDADFPWGGNLRSLRKIYKGAKKGKITDEERREIEKLGLIPPEKNPVEETLNVCRILHEKGIKLGKLPRSKSVNKKSVDLTLKDLVELGYISQTILDEGKLDEEFPWGSRIHYITRMYDGTETAQLEESQRHELEMFGLVERDVIEENIDLCRILFESGVDLSRIPQCKKVNGKSIYLTLGDLVKRGLISQSVLDENGLESGFIYPSRIRHLRDLLLKDRGLPEEKRKLTPDQIRRLEEYRILPESKITGQQVGQATFTASAEQCQELDSTITELVEQKDTTKKPEQ